MTTASRSLATALPMGALRERLALPSYTTSGDTTTSITSHWLAWQRPISQTKDCKRGTLTKRAVPLHT